MRSAATHKPVTAVACVRSVWHCGSLRACWRTGGEERGHSRSWLGRAGEKWSIRLLTSAACLLVSSGEMTPIACHGCVVHLFDTTQPCNAFIVSSRDQGDEAKNDARTSWTTQICTGPLCLTTQLSSTEVTHNVTRLVKSNSLLKTRPRGRVAQL